MTFKKLVHVKSDFILITRTLQANDSFLWFWFYSCFPFTVRSRSWSDKHASLPIWAKIAHIIGQWFLDLTRVTLDIYFYAYVADLKDRKSFMETCRWKEPNTEKKLTNRGHTRNQRREDPFTKSQPHRQSPMASRTSGARNFTIHSIPPHYWIWWKFYYNNINWLD